MGNSAVTFPIAPGPSWPPAVRQVERVKHVRSAVVREPWLFTMLAATVVLNFVDAALTLFAVRAGWAVEANPLMDELLFRGPVSFMIGKMAVVSLGVLLLWRLRRHTMSIVGTIAGFFAYTAILSIHIKGLLTLFGY